MKTPPLKRFSCALALFGCTAFSPAAAFGDFSFGDVDDIDDAVRLESAIYATLPEARLSKFEGYYVLRLVAVALSGNPALQKHYYKSLTCAAAGFHEALRHTTAPSLIEAFKQAHTERANRYRPAFDKKIAAAEDVRKTIDESRKLSEMIQHAASLTARELPEDVILRKYVRSKLDSFRVAAAETTGKPGALGLTFANNTGNIAVREVTLQVRIMAKGREEPLFAGGRLVHGFSRELNPGDERTETVTCSPECQEALRNPDAFPEATVLTLNGHPVGDYRSVSLSAGHEWDTGSADQHLKTYLGETLPGIRSELDKTAAAYDDFMKSRSR